jgi:hypothetical protein
MLAQEARLEQTKQAAIQKPLTINLAESSSSTENPSPTVNATANLAFGQPSTSNPQNFAQKKSYNQPNSYNKNETGNRDFGRWHGQGRGGGRGRNVQCQICSKKGHEASTCYQRASPFSFGSYGFNPFTQMNYFTPQFNPLFGASFPSMGFGPQMTQFPVQFGAQQFSPSQCMSMSI